MDNREAQDHMEVDMAAVVVVVVAATVVAAEAVEATMEAGTIGVKPA